MVFPMPFFVVFLIVYKVLSLHTVWFVLNYP